MSVPAGRFFFTSPMLALSFGLVWVQPIRAQSKQSHWADILERSEKLVRTAHGVVETKYSLTDPDQLKELKRLCRLSGGPERWKEYAYSEGLVNRNSHVSEWWRKGEMERFDRLPPEGREKEYPLGFVEATAFDGNIVRGLATGRGVEMNGSIDSIESSGWSGTNRHLPFSFLFEFQTTPYSDIVRRSPEFSETIIVKNGQEFTLVKVRHPDHDSIDFAMTFDDQCRLVERLYLKQWKSQGQESPQPQERHVMKDYELLPVGGGNLVWFPRRADYHLYANLIGTLPDGQPVAYTTKTISIRKIDFNVEIPVAKFQLEFPPGANIYDGLTGAGWISGTHETLDRVFGQLEELTLDALKEQEIKHPKTREDMELPALVPGQKEADSAAESIGAVSSVPFIVGCIALLLLITVTARSWWSKRQERAGE